MVSRSFCAAILAASLLAASACEAQGYPSKPVRVIVPFPPGGVDALARVVTTVMTEVMGQPVILDNRPGANGIIGSEMVMRAAPDGYTLLVTASNALVSVLFQATNAPAYHPVRDFTPIGGMYDGVQTIAVRAGLPVNSLKELIDLARRNPGKLTYASSAIGSPFHMYGEALKQMTGIDILHVPYKGTGPAARALIAGEIDIAFPSLGNLSGSVSRVKVIAINGPKRYSRYPEIPTMGDTVPGFKAIPSAIALFGPAQLPRPIVMRVNADLLKALQSPAVKTAYDQQDAVDIGGTPEELAETVRGIVENIAALVKLTGIKLE